MKLHEYIMQNTADGAEVTVWDTVYDMESYFYHEDAPEDIWDKSMERLQKLLTVKEVRERGVVVDLWGLIEYNLDALIQAGLFSKGGTEAIMDSMEAVISGYVSEEWLKRFVTVLRDPEEKIEADKSAKEV